MVIDAGITKGNKIITCLKYDQSLYCNRMIMLLDCILTV